MVTPSRWLWVLAGLGVSVAVGCEKENTARQDRGSAKLEAVGEPRSAVSDTRAADAVAAALWVGEEPLPAPTSVAPTLNVVQAGSPVAQLAPVPVFAQPPPLLAVETEFSVVQDHEVPVYYTEKQYWMVRDDGWYHSPRWDQPWVIASVEIVPKIIVARDHTRYVRYRGEPHVKVWREPAVRYSGPALFYNPPPLVTVEPDVYVVEDNDVPVYYTGGHYWQQRDNRWYRTSRWNEPWVDIEVTVVPRNISHREHHRYVRYRDDRQAHVFRELRHQRAEARRDARLARESRAELRRERERLAAEADRRVERRRLAAERAREREREQARRELARVDADRARLRREQARLEADRDNRRREQARLEATRDKRRQAQERLAALQEKSRAERARIEATRDRARQEQGRLAAEREKTRKEQLRVAAERDQRRRAQAVAADRARKPTPASAPREERRRVDERRKDAPKAKVVKRPVAVPARPVKRPEAPGKDRSR